MHISPHLCFDGQCRTASAAYQQILGGTIQTMLTYGESPMAAQVEPLWHDRILHATLQFGDIELTGVDLLPADYRKPQGFFVTLTMEGATRASRVFASLAEGGEVRFPFQPTFWSPGFGVVIDRFAIPWEISSVEPPIST
jgi:PhnB protein